MSRLAYDQVLLPRHSQGSASTPRPRRHLSSSIPSSRRDCPAGTPHGAPAGSGDPEWVEHAGGSTRGPSAGRRQANSRALEQLFILYSAGANACFSDAVSSPLGPPPRPRERRTWSCDTFARDRQPQQLPSSPVQLSVHLDHLLASYLQLFAATLRPTRPQPAPLDVGAPASSRKCVSDGPAGRCRTVSVVCAICFDRSSCCRRAPSVPAETRESSAVRVRRSSRV